MKPLPTLFVSHGSPMHAIAPGEVGDAWHALGQRLQRPEAVLVSSAHWETALPMVTGSARPETIHDFGGFPQALYEIRYPARGNPDLATEVVRLLKNAGITAGIDGCRGLDHGVWVPLRWMYPDADIPVIQLSVSPARGTAHHLALGRALQPLRETGVLIVGSGHATHNLRDWIVNRGRGEPLRYAVDFTQWLEQRLNAHDDAALTHYRDEAPDAARAHPTEEHYLPLLVAYGAAGSAPPVERVVDGYENGALSRDSFLFGPSA
ncbi:MAG TPA: 4,5-DOPA dioxygenase extradiol [Casimicrobiaceae bacterium]|nr:4,5-DOPA dioxygenase extradiol [Casimicrobiaceae bacterium]